MYDTSTMAVIGLTETQLSCCSWSIASQLLGITREEKKNKVT